ncbi:MAG: enoyl-CoA hydratase, partial [Pseudomonadota bacterium]|nr:enoyl-CoA hydratase [Pseudomonadota bacterium]
LIEKTQSVAEVIAANAPMSVKSVKKAMNHGISLNLTQAMEVDLALYKALIATNDRKEGINAFNEKRKPAFTGE